MITAEDILTTSGKHPDRLQWVSPAVEKNATDLAPRVTELLTRFGESRTLNSGFRDPDSNKEANGAPYSRHMYGLAADIEDDDKRLTKFITEELLAELGLWMEAPSSTPSWVHVQSVPPPSGRRIFVP